MSHCTCDYHQEQNKNECFTDIKFEKDGSSSIELNYHIIDENDKCIRCGIFVHGMVEMVENLSPKSLKYSASKTACKSCGRGEECDCAKMSCKDTCLRDHTHKTFSCRVCDPLVATNIEEKKDFEEEKIPSLGFIRQFCGEQPKGTMFSAEELWRIFEAFAPLMTEEQEKALKDNLNLIMKKS